MFNLEIETSNAAFEDRPAEIARILRETADVLENEGEAFRNLSLYDVNGNYVGLAVMKEKE